MYVPHSQKFKTAGLQNWQLLVGISDEFAKLEWHRMTGKYNI